MLTYRTEVKEVSIAAKRWSWIVPHKVYELNHALDYYECKRWEKEIGGIPQGFSPRKLASSPTGKRVASQPPLTLIKAPNPRLRNQVFHDPAILLNNSLPNINNNAALILCKK